MPDILFPYTNVDLTEEVNRIPNRFGLLNALNLAPVDPMSSRYVRIDFRDGELVVLAADEPGSPGQTSEPEQEQGTILMIPHFPHVETIRTGAGKHLVHKENVVQVDTPSGIQSSVLVYVDTACARSVVG